MQKRKHRNLGINSSTPIPVSLSRLHAYETGWENNTVSQWTITASYDHNLDFYVFDYIARKLDFEIYMPVVKSMKESFSLDSTPQS